MTSFCEVYSCSWVARSHGLFTVEFGEVVFEVEKVKKTVINDIRSVSESGFTQLAVNLNVSSDSMSYTCDALS